MLSEVIVLPEPGPEQVVCLTGPQGLGHGHCTSPHCVSKPPSPLQVAQPPVAGIGESGLRVRCENKKKLMQVLEHLQFMEEIMCKSSVTSASNII